MTDCIILEDEQQSIEILQRMLKEEFSGTLNIVACCNTIAEAKKAILQHRPALAFVDVQIGNDTSFDLLKETDLFGMQIIFITAYEKYAIQAFKFSAIDYLLKPISMPELNRAVLRVLEQQHEAEGYKRIETLLKNIYNKERQKLCIPDINGFNIVEIKDIIRCESKVNYTTIHVAKGNPITVAKSLKEFEKMLEEHNFFRVHNSHLINLDYVKSYNKNKGGYVLLNNGDEIDISVRRKDEFMKKIIRHS